MTVIQVGGVLREGALEVPREQLQTLCDWLAEGELVYLIGPRQVGKSTMAQSAIRQLAASAQIQRAIRLDLLGLIDLEEPPSQRFDRLCSAVARQLDILKDYRSWQRSEALEGAGTVLWTRFWEDFVLGHTEGRVLVVIDELDDLLSTTAREPATPAENGELPPREPFKDDFLLTIRRLYQSEQENPEIRRLTFCLVGSRPPGWLISDPSRTPMNVGRRLVVEDFSGDEVSVFLPFLEPLARRAEAVLEQIVDWTGGHPQFTAEIVRELVEKERPIAPTAEKTTVEQLVEALFLGNSAHAVFEDTSRRVLRPEPGASVAQRLETYELLLDQGSLDYRGREPLHLALVLDGLARVLVDRGDRLLVPRNNIFRRFFDLEWVRGLRRSTKRLSPEADGSTPSSDTLRQVRGLVDEMFAGAFQVLGDGVEILADTLFTFPVSKVSNVRRPLTLQVYRVHSGAGAELWEQEVRALERLSGSPNPIFPVLVEAGFDEDRGLAFTLAFKGRMTLASMGAVESLRRHLPTAVREFLSMSRGLLTLQQQGLMHRNLWAGTVEVVEDLQQRGAEGWKLRLTGFQMSALLGNMLRRLGAGQQPNIESIDALVRTFFRRQGRDALAGSPPERLAFVFPEEFADDHTTDRFENAAVDVFSLAMVFYPLFVGPLPDDLLEAAFPGDGLAARFSFGAYKRLHSELRSKAGRHAAHPDLGKLMRDMLEWQAARRPRIFEVVASLHRHYDSIQRVFDGAATPFFLAYMPEQTGIEFYKRGWMTHEPQTEQGEAELWDFLFQDLRDARMTFSEQGAVPYVAAPDERHARARYVLLGRQAAYFGMMYEDRTGNLAGVAVPQVFLITFASDASKTWRLRESQVQRTLPNFTLVSWDDPRLQSEAVNDAPSWRPFLDSVERSGKHPDHQVFEDALDWLLAVEAADLTNRQYAVTSSQRDDGSILLTWNRKREREIFFADIFQRFYSSERPTFGDHFLHWSFEEGGSLYFELDRWDSWRSRRVKNKVEVRFVRRLSESEILVSANDPVAAHGWLRAEGEIGRQVMLGRQLRARAHVAEMPNLVNQLLKPRTVRRRRRSWIGAGSGLRGNAGHFIRKMLDSRPLFGLQGPPGTGKTTLTARAVAMALRRDRSQRILISAQSHYALDNLAKRILRELGDAGVNTLAVRVASESSIDKIADESIRQILTPELVDRQIARIRRADLSRFEEDPKLHGIARRWRQAAPAHALELQDRILRGANILFATTGTATSQFLGLADERAVCDWAIVEEAGKAWPTELAIPMIQARRWTLIGDHLQLPPYGKDQMVALLKRCGRDSDPEIQAHAKHAKEYLQAFELFGSLFTKDSDATDSLTTQFRMAPTIGGMVSRSFYGGKLATDEFAGRDTLAIEHPKNLQGYPLIWLESGPDAKEEPAWENRREIEIVAQVVEGLMRNRPEPTTSQLVVLSPYRQQCRKLEIALGQHARFVHTVDSFQGKEADIVIVSLVRVNRAQRTNERLGFLATPTRINVMMSRARGTLILVGSFEHFKHSGVEHWEAICGDVVTRGGGVLRWGDHG